MASKRRSAADAADPGPRPRAAWGTISRGEVIEAATKMVRAGGYEQMTIRGLAAELGVAPMSLYRHVRDKDDLLEEVVDRLLARTWKPRVPDPDDWRAWIADAAERLRHFLVRQPAALHVYLRRPVGSPTMARMTAMIEVLRSAGLREDAALRAYGTIHTYTIGFAALEASRARSLPGGTARSETEQQLAAFTSPAQFREGVTYLIEGIDRRLSHP